MKFGDHEEIKGHPVEYLVVIYFWENVDHEFVHRFLVFFLLSLILNIPFNGHPPPNSFTYLFPRILAAQLLYFRPHVMISV